VSKPSLNSMLGALTASAVVLAAPAPAQSPAAATAETTSGREGNLSEIIVTARRVEERLQDVPISITVFNQQQLTNRNIVNAQDIAAYTPSLSANTNFGSANSTFAIRGFVQDIGTQPSVGVYFADVVSPRGASAGIPVGDGAGPGSFWDLQNVQVLKGPQGTLFGRNTTGGAILMVPQKPTAKEEGYAEVSFGNYDLKRIQAVENIPLNDAIRLRVGVDHQSRDGYLNNDTGIGGARLGDVDYTAARASLVVDITPDLENYTVASYLVSDTNGEIQKVIGCNPTLSAANFLGLLACGQLAAEQAKGAGFYTVQNTLSDPDTRLEQWQVVNTTTWHATDTLTIKNIASYAQVDEKYRNGLFGTNFFLAPGAPIAFTNSTPIPGGSTADESTATEEIQLQGRTADDKLTWQSGGYVEDVEPLQLSGSQSPTFLNCVNSDNFNCENPLGAGAVGYIAAKQYFFDAGAFEQATYSLTDTLKLTEGFRYTWDRTISNNSVITYLVPTPGVGVAICTNPGATLPSCSADYRESSSAPTWLLGLDYKPTDDTLVYGKYSRGYRAGGISARAPSEFAVFQPERVDTYETGIKTSFRGPVSGTFDIAGFYNNFSDQQLQLNLDGKPGEPVAPATAIVNAGKSRIWGLEVESSLALFEGFTLDTSYTYLNAKIKQISVGETPADSSYVIDSPVHVGDTLTLTPRNKLSTTGTYALPLPDGIGRVDVAATFTHTNEELVNYVDRTSPIPAIAALSTLPALNLLNLNLGWRSMFGSHVDTSLFATNVTNKQYYTFVPGLYDSTGFETASLGQPRMYGVRLRYSW
jgi:iron complex outermembrane receptor protein